LVRQSRLCLGGCKHPACHVAATPSATSNRDRLRLVLRLLGGYGGQVPLRRLTFIEPYPKLLHELLGETTAQVRILEARVQDVPLEIFDDLAAGDVLFIDSTHILRTGSDVCHELFEILPRLAPGVLVHIHDMFWPFEYPRTWVVEENRSWNELQAVRAFLTGNADWEVIWFSDYMTQLERPLLETTCPRVLRNSGGALWLRRR
jgi:Methyltransferase domain